MKADGVVDVDVREDAATVADDRGPTFRISAAIISSHWSF